MKRDDYKVKDTMIFEESQEDSINSIIDNIFDDFENIVCENCKFWHQEYLCLEVGNGTFKTESSFCCNRWVLK